MTQQDLFNSFKEKMCPYCKAKCEKGIMIAYDYEECELYGRCIDYVSNKNLVEAEGYKEI